MIVDHANVNPERTSKDKVFTSKKLSRLIPKPKAENLKRSYIENGKKNQNIIYDIE